MHVVPVPAGAGLAIVAAVLVLWPAWHVGRMDQVQLVLLACFVGLAALSWVDDRRGLSPLIRLGAQFAAVALCLAMLGPEVRALPFLPLGVERLVIGLAWLWFTNLFNFMDGIDGLAGCETVAIALGCVALLVAAGMDASPYWRLALIVAAASAGYLLWNWHPAKVMMGDAGSIPLGFLLGWLMIHLAVNRQWAAAAILPLYFVADATITLLRRLARGDRPWQAHREHFYQRAVLGGNKPSAVALRVTIANVLLIGLALFSLQQPVLAVLAAVLVVTALLAHLQRLADATPPAPSSS
jgi:UDP-N-acetylmuramyl pentapeptide phosphotransferase/UDP-N-acetylglucosamine-1-phosphate transferase